MLAVGRELWKYDLISTSHRWGNSLPLNWAGTYTYIHKTLILVKKEFTVKDMSEQYSPLYHQTLESTAENALRSMEVARVTNES